MQGIIKKFFRFNFLALFTSVFIIKLSIPIFGEERPLPDPVGYAKRFLSDLEELPAKPKTWSKKQWYFAGGVVAATGLSLFIDDSVADFYDKHRFESLRNTSFATTDFGDYKWQVPIISGFYIGGVAFGSITMRKIAADATEASVIAGLIINPAICYMTGRALPSSGESPSHFRPFTWHRYSFPSGHTSAAFALASVLDVDLRSTFGYWHTPFVYAMALGVANSRLYDRKHYLSDVIFGGAIGWSIGTWIASKNSKVAPADITLLPYLNGARIAYRF